MAPWIVVGQGPLSMGNSPGKNTRVGCHALLQGIFPTQGWNPGLLHCSREAHWLLYDPYYIEIYPIYINFLSYFYHGAALAKEYWGQSVVVGHEVREIARSQIPQYLMLVLGVCLNLQWLGTYRSVRIKLCDLIFHFILLSSLFFYLRFNLVIQLRVVPVYGPSEASF